MPNSMPSHPREISAAWLEQVLAAGVAGELRPEIENLRIELAPKWNQAEIAFLEVAYGRGGTGLPTRLFVKLRQEPDPLADIFPGEQHFYQLAKDAALPIAPCLAAIADEATGATCILLEDLRETHVAAEWPLPPNLDRCQQALAALARLHAWGRQPARSDLAARELRLGQHVADLLPRFVEKLGDRLPKDRADLLVRACQRVPQIKEAYYQSSRSIARVHGDAHFWNFLYPRSPAQGHAVLIDWEDWRLDIAGTDLALLMAMHWYPDRRARHERGLLQHYLTCLNAHIAQPTTWDELWWEYRLGHLCNAAIPLFQQAAGHQHASWWSHLERWFLAFEDLQCAELL